MKRVRIADLTAHLSEHLRAVRRGETVEVLDRDTPIARIVPYDAPPRLTVVRPARGRLRDLVLPPPPLVPVDSLALLLEERRERFEP